MLQEKHLNLEESLKLKQRWVGQVFSSPGSRGCRGVSILISKKISFNLIDMVSDKGGRYLILFGTLQNVKCTMVNIYAPNCTQASFLCPIASCLAQFANHPILIVGYFNLVKDAVVGRLGHPLPADRALLSA